MTIGTRKLGPNMKRFLAVCFARIAIPPGGGFADGMAALSSAERIKENTLKALALADQSIAVMRTASDKYYSDDEEEIAGIIMSNLDKREDQT